jgi:hypothetical protein
MIGDWAVGSWVVIVGSGDACVVVARWPTTGPLRSLDVCRVGSSEIERIAIERLRPYGSQP